MRSAIIAPLLTATFIITPLFALAQTPPPPPPPTINASVSVTATTTPPPPPPRLGPAIKEFASSTRETFKDVASSTREAVAARVAAIKDLIAQHKQALEARRADLQLRVDAAKTKAQTKFNEQIQTGVNALVDKLTNATSRLNDSANRIEAYLNVLEAEGKDTSQAQSLLVDARADITIATQKAADASVALDAALSASAPKAEMPKVRAAVQAAAEAIRAAHQALLAIIPVMRASTSTEAEATAPITQ